MSGQYIFRVPIISKWEYKSYRKTGVHKVDWLALRLRRLLVKEKIKFTWRERKLNDCVKITIRF
jgi:hypothetical protein